MDGTCLLLQPYGSWFIAAAQVNTDMAYIVMAYIVMAYIVMAYIWFIAAPQVNTDMAYIVMAYIVMAYIVLAYIVMAYIVMACMVMAYIVMSMPTANAEAEYGSECSIGKVSASRVLGHLLIGQRTSAAAPLHAPKRRSQFV